MDLRRISFATTLWSKLKVNEDVFICCWGSRGHLTLSLQLANQRVIF